MTPAPETEQPQQAGSFYVPEKDQETAEPAAALDHDEGPPSVDPAEVEEQAEDAIDLVNRLQDELEEANAARQRSLADLCNLQRRAAENESRALKTGAADVARSMLPVIDHLDLALDQDLEQVTVEQLADGVKLVRDELIRALASHGVARIEPAVGDPFDPNQHEAMMRQAAEGVDPDHITGVLQVGYAMGEFVLRPAKVAVAVADEAAPDPVGEARGEPASDDDAPVDPEDP